MKRIIRLTESDLTRIVKRVIKETQEVDELFGFGKRRKKDDDEHYVIVKKFRGKNDVKLIQEKGVDPYVGNGRIEFNFAKAGEDDVRDFKAVYKKDGSSLKTHGWPLDISDEEQRRLNNKYF